MKNITFAIQAIAAEMSVFLHVLSGNKMFIGFLAGIIVAFLVTGFILTKNPRNIPAILRYSSVKSFEKIAKRQGNGTYELSYTDFLAVYIKIKTLFTILVVAFCMVIVTVLLTQ